MTKGQSIFLCIGVRQNKLVRKRCEENLGSFIAWTLL